MNALPRVKPGLLRHRLDDQVLVYDPATDATHLLDLSTGALLELLVERGSSVEDASSELSRRLNSKVNDGVVLLALDELKKAGLLDESSAPRRLSDVSRRDAIRRLGLAGATAIMVPVIATLTADSALAQTSCINAGGTPNGGSCLSNNNCCRDNCIQNPNGPGKICAP